MASSLGLLQRSENPLFKGLELVEGGFKCVLITSQEHVRRCVGVGGLMLGNLGWAQGGQSDTLALLGKGISVKVPVMGNPTVKEPRPSQ